jgi:hypothetical protein
MKAGALGAKAQSRVQRQLLQEFSSGRGHQAVAQVGEY